MKMLHNLILSGSEGYLHAGCRLAGTSGEVSLSAATAKTAIQIIAAAQHRVRIVGISVYFKDTVVTDTPVKIRVVRQTTAGTPGSSPALVKKDENMGETIQTTMGINYSAEPTITDVLETLEVHPQTGMKWYYPMGEEIFVKGGNRFGVELTAAQAQTCTVNVEVEE